SPDGTILPWQEMLRPQHLLPVFSDGSERFLEIRQAADQAAAPRVAPACANLKNRRQHLEEDRKFLRSCCSQKRRVRLRVADSNRSPAHQAGSSAYPSSSGRRCRSGGTAARPRSRG